MTYSLTWLPNVLRAAGLNVKECDGWQTRGRGDVGTIEGVMCHHTGTAKKPNDAIPTLRILIDGVTQDDGTVISGPLAQLGLGRDGTYHVIAAGRANHAGRGKWRDLEDGNLNFIGIEAENAGTAGDFPWPEVQMEAYRRGVAAILRHIGKSADLCCGHKEYRLPPGRKDDPSFDMNVFRAEVAALLGGAGTNWPTLRFGMTHPLVREIQRKLAVTPRSGYFGHATENAVRAFQKAQNLSVDGVVGRDTWVELEKIP